MRSSDLKFLSTFFWLGPVGSASRAGSVALLTSFGGRQAWIQRGGGEGAQAPPVR